MWPTDHDASVIDEGAPSAHAIAQADEPNGQRSVTTLPVCALRGHSPRPEAFRRWSCAPRSHATPTRAAAWPELITGYTSKLDQVTPSLTPAIEEVRNVRFHKLEAAVELVVLDDPAVEIPKSVREHPAVGCSALVHGPWPSDVAFDDHIEHRRTLRVGHREARSVANALTRRVPA